METKEYKTVRILTWGVYPIVLLIMITCMFFSFSNKGLQTVRASSQTENVAE